MDHHQTTRARIELATIPSVIHPISAHSITDAPGGVSSYTCDAAGNVIAQIDPRGNRTPFSNDALNRPFETQDALGGLATVVVTVRRTTSCGGWYDRGTAWFKDG